MRILEGVQPFFLPHLSFQIFFVFPLSYIGALLNRTRKTQMQIAGEKEEKEKEINI